MSMDWQLGDRWNDTSSRVLWGGRVGWGMFRLGNNPGGRGLGSENSPALEIQWGQKSKTEDLSKRLT